MWFSQNELQVQALKILQILKKKIFWRWKNCNEFYLSSNEIFKFNSIASFSYYLFSSKYQLPTIQKILVPKNNIHNFPFSNPIS